MTKFEKFMCNVVNALTYLKGQETACWCEDNQVDVKMENGDVYRITIIKINEYEWV